MKKNNSTKNLLDSYKFNEIDEKSKEYLTKYFSNTDNIGRHAPYFELVFNDKHFGNINTVDDYNTYKINRYGLRGEIDENSDVIASGCSITFGLGVPELARWSNLLSNKINKSVINLGNEGASVETVCTNIIQYCMNNKMPKEIFCLFPDFFRRMIVVDKEYYKPSKEERPAEDYLFLEYSSLDIDGYKDFVIVRSKDEQYTKNLVSPHQLILDSINFIYILESFCLTNNIKLYWTTWDIYSDLIMKELLNIKDFKLKNFKSFFSSNLFKGIGNFIESTCNLDHNSEFKDNICWKVGSDYSIIDNKKTPDRAHPGVHAHTHIAEFFYNLYNQSTVNQISMLK